MAMMFIRILELESNRRKWFGCGVKIIFNNEGIEIFDLYLDQGICISFNGISTYFKILFNIRLDNFKLDNTDETLKQNIEKLKSISVSEEFSRIMKILFDE